MDPSTTVISNSFSAMMEKGAGAGVAGGWERRVLQSATAAGGGDEKEKKMEGFEAQKQLAPRKKRENDVQHRGERGFIQVQGERD